MTKILPIEPNEKLRFSDSCVIGVAQMLGRWYYGGTLDQQYAADWTRCVGEGVGYVQLSRLLVMPRKMIKNISEVREMIDARRPVVATVFYEEPHAVLIVGYDDTGFYIIDPNRRKVERYSSEWVEERCKEMHAHIEQTPKRRITRLR